MPKSKSRKQSQSQLRSNECVTSERNYRRLAKASLAVLLAGGLVAVAAMVMVRTESNTAYGLGPCDFALAPTPGPARAWESSQGVSTYSSVNVYTGNLFTAMPVVSWSGHGPGMNMMLYHNSAHVTSGYDLSKGSGVDLGPGWNIAYGDQLILDVPNNKVTVLWADGRVDSHVYSGGQWHGHNGAHDQLEQDPIDSTIWRVRHKDQSYHEFKDETGVDPAVRLTSIVDATQNVLTVNYETIGQDRRIDNVVAADRTLDFQYDAVTGRLEKFYKAATDFANRSWPVAYDASNRLASLTDARGNENVFAYDTNGRITLTSDKKTPTGGPGCGTGSCCEVQPTSGCDDQACCTTVCAFDSFCCDSTWDEFCVGFAETDCSICPAPIESDYLFAYDIDGHLETVTDPKGQTSSFLFYCVSDGMNFNRRRTRYTDIRGNNWITSFIAGGVTEMPNNIGTLEWAENPFAFDSRRNYTFDGSRNLVHYVGPTNRWFTATYDTNGNLLTVANSGSETKTWTYDLNPPNNLIAYTDGAGNMTRFYYENPTFPTLLTTIEEPNATSNPPYGPDPANYPVTTMDYDFSTGGGCTPITGGYQCQGMLKTVTDPNGVVTRFMYDQWGQTDLYSEGLVSGVYGYTLNADLNSAGFPTGGSTNGVSTVTDCSGIPGGVASAASSGGSTSSDSNGNTTSSACWLSLQASLFGTPQCSGAGFPFSCSAPAIPARSASFTAATYDTMDRSLVTPLSLELENPKLRTITNQYDPFGRLSSRTVSSNESGSTIPRPFTYVYDDLSGLTTRTGPDGHNTLIQVDTANRVQSVTRQDAGGTVVMSAVYNYFDDDTVARPNPSVV